MKMLDAVVCQVRVFFFNLLDRQMKKDINMLSVSMNRGLALE